MIGIVVQLGWWGSLYESSVRVRKYEPMWPSDTRDYELAIVQRKFEAARRTGGFDALANGEELLHSASMLTLHPNCEICDADLPPETDQARICTYECTYCASCAEAVLKGVCPNCGGNIVPRPIRPKGAWRSGTGLDNHPASTTRRHNKYSVEDRKALSDKLKDTPAQDR